MLVKINCLILIFIAAATCAYAQTGSKAPDKDEDAIRQIVKDVENGWNTHSGKAFAASFAADADYVVVNGMYVKGREAIERGHQQIFDTVFKDSGQKSNVKSIRFLRSDVAVVHIEWELTVRSEGKEDKARALNTMFMSKENGKWSIAAFHNTPIK